MRPVTHTDHVLRVKQCIRVPDHILFRQRGQVMDDDSRPDGLSVPYHPVCDLMVRATKVTPAVPHNDSVPELPPFSRLIEVLIQIPVKPERVVANSPM